MRLRLISGIVACAIWLGPAFADEPDFSWRADETALPDAQTAIMVSVYVFRAQVHVDLPAPEAIAKRLKATRYRSRDDKPDPNGDVWFVEPSDEAQAAFERECNHQCVGGILYTMVLSAHDGRVLEFYIPE